MSARTWWPTVPQSWRPGALQNSANKLMACRLDSELLLLCWQMERAMEQWSIVHTRNQITDSRHWSASLV